MLELTDCAFDGAHFEIVWFAALVLSGLDAGPWFWLAAVLDLRECWKFEHLCGEALFDELEVVL